MSQIGFPELIIILVIIVCALAVVIVPWWQILKKAGHSPGLSFLMLLPLVNLATLFWFAFSEWPLEKQLRDAGTRRPTRG
jgi:hypothetical protein